jgi:hypothetical protein
MLPIALGLAFAQTGWHSLQTGWSNRSVRPMALKDLPAAPPEKPTWVSVEGVVVPGSMVEKDRQRFILFQDPGSKTALFVRLAGKSTLADARETRILLGMLSPAAKGGAPEERNAPPETRVAAVILAEDEGPPPYWHGALWLVLAWCLAMIGWDRAREKA